MLDHPPEPVYSRNNTVFGNRLKTPQALNKTLLAAFIKWQDNDDVRKTHLFDGRYENIYLNEQHIPELVPLIENAVSSAESILGIHGLRAGYWFNYMPPGASTTLHTHDDDDELLSGVYYVHVPENSGHLIIHENTPDDEFGKIVISPDAGEFIFFKADARHEVSENLSTEHRLSIGMNFGKPDPERTL